jgi:hypothetical protein
MAYLKTTSALAQVNLHAPIGTKMLFNQTASPLGWTKDTGSTDVALRLTSGTVGTGGSVAFETALASVTPTITMSNDAVSLSVAQLAAHNHSAATTSGSGTVSAHPRLVGSNYSGWTNGSPGAINASGSGTTHVHTNTAASSAINLDVSYVDVIMATKD